MRVALVNPPQPYLVEPGKYEPLGLEYIMGAVRVHLPSVEIELLDLAACTLPEATSRIANGGYDIVGYTATSLGIRNVEMVAGNVRMLRGSDAPLEVIGGPHITATHGDSNFRWDAIFCGDGEHAFVQYLCDVMNEGIRPRILYGPASQDNDDPHRVPGYDIVSAIGSRGCNMRCAFCAAQALRPGRVRRYKARDVAYEIQRACASRHTNKAALFDEDVMSNNHWLTEFCSHMHNSGIEWRAQGRVDLTTIHDMEMMRAAGCVQIDFGVESFDAAVLLKLNKRVLPQHIMTAVVAASEAGISPRLFMMIGTPGHNAHTVDLNMFGLKQLREHIGSVNMYTFMPLPGTPIAETPHLYGITVIDHDWSKYNRHQYRKTPDGVTSEAWSPIDVDRIPHAQLLADIKRMHEFVNTAMNVNRGESGNFGAEEVHE